jgi:hypothetical protein
MVEGKGFKVFQITPSSQNTKIPLDLRGFFNFAADFSRVKSPEVTGLSVSEEKTLSMESTCCAKEKSGADNKSTEIKKHFFMCQTIA